MIMISTILIMMVMMMMISVYVSIFESHLCRYDRVHAERRLCVFLMLLCLQLSEMFWRLQGYMRSVMLCRCVDAFPSRGLISP